MHACVWIVKIHNQKVEGTTRVVHLLQLPTLISKSPKVIVCITWCCIFCRFRQMYNESIHHYNIIQFFITLKPLSVPPIHLLSHTLTQPLITTNSFSHLHSFAFIRMSYSWDHVVCS